MTANELAAFINRSGTWSTPLSDIKIRVTIKDARVIFGRLELKVTPMAGSGEAWAQNVELDERRIWMKYEKEK